MIEKIKLHIIIAKIVKYVLSFFVFLILSLVAYFAIVNSDVKIRHQNDLVDDVNKDSPRIKITNPNLLGINLKHGPYTIIAEDLEQNHGEIKFVKPSVEMTINRESFLNVSANQAFLIEDNNNLQLVNNVKANFNKLYFFDSEYAEVIKNKSIVKSDKFVKLYNEQSTLTSGTGFLLNYETEIASFWGKIKVHTVQKDGSVDISSDTLAVFLNEGKSIFQGKVLVIKNGTEVRANKMVVFLDKSTDEIEKIFLYGNVKIIDKENTSTSEYGEYFEKTSILTLKNNVKLNRNGSVLTGEVLNYNFNTKRADLVGEVNSQGKRRVKAEITNTTK